MLYPSYYTRFPRPCHSVSGRSFKKEQPRAARRRADGEKSFYEDPTKFFYKCKAKKGDFYADGTPAAKDAIVLGSGLTAEEIAYYDSKGEILDEDGITVLQSAIWAKTEIWKKSTLWTPNEININLETDSKIKFAGKKIETVWTIDDVDYKMDDILLSTNTLSTDAGEVVFEQKISKNGDREGQDSEIVYTFGNNVADTTKVADFAAFKKNYNGKHTPKTDEELQAMYDAFLAEGESFEIRVKVSELLGLVQRVADLEARIAVLEGSMVSGVTGVQGPMGPNGVDGAQGPQGNDGMNGSGQGVQGPMGPAGADGAQGTAGESGPQGPQGPDGLTGADGAQGPQGEAGENGESGMTFGVQGPQGTGIESIYSTPNSANGKNTVYVITTDGIVAGFEYSDGAQGAQGVAGENGVDGNDGPQGPQGPDGIQGPQGAQNA